MFELHPPKDDDLYIPKVKEHSRGKHYFLMRHIGARARRVRGIPLIFSVFQPSIESAALQHQRGERAEGLMGSSEVDSVSQAH